MSKATITRTCPACGPTVFLIQKWRRVDKKPFLGCPNFYTDAHCTYTEEWPVEMHLRDIGAPRLFPDEDVKR